jgi:hypothetical protein
MPRLAQDVADRIRHVLVELQRCHSAFSASLPLRRDWDNAVAGPMRVPKILITPFPEILITFP